jgi:hypothetical protein
MPTLRHASGAAIAMLIAAAVSAGDAARMRFAIPSQSVRSALQLYARQSGFQVIYYTDRVT